MGRLCFQLGRSMRGWAGQTDPRPCHLPPRSQEKGHVEVEEWPRKSEPARLPGHAPRGSFSCLLPPSPSLHGDFHIHLDARFVSWPLGSLTSSRRALSPCFLLRPRSPAAWPPGNRGNRTAASVSSIPRSNLHLFVQLIPESHWHPQGIGPIFLCPPSRPHPHRPSDRIKCRCKHQKYSPEQNGDTSLEVTSYPPNFLRASHQPRAGMLKAPQVSP